MILSGQISVLFCKNEREFDRFFLFIFAKQSLHKPPLYPIFNRIYNTFH